MICSGWRGGNQGPARQSLNESGGLRITRPKHRRKALHDASDTTIAWPNRSRHLAKDLEVSLESALTWLMIASVKLLSRRLARA